ncbi:chromate transporter [Holdemania massiliensis]|uniref:chromate transporter n=1 Tax=Holdemania massiliensis TaxID=1468449 RepID=UPI001F05B4CA|nr:chromate transporter [Holdemania massiliensis]MCH1939179.1 chromate transporter [Holdemania massiliensis]
MEKKQEVSLIKMFTSTFTLSMFTFGGGFVIVPLMKKKFVDELHWVEEKEMMDLVAIAQSSPGAIAVNGSIIIGYRLKGIVGALVNILATVLPPLIILTIISYCYDAFRSSAVVSFAMRGMQAAVAAVIVDVVFNMIKGLIVERNRVGIIVMILALIANSVFKVNILILIVVCGAIGTVNTMSREKARKERIG